MRKKSATSSQEIFVEMNWIRRFACTNTILWSIANGLVTVKFSSPLLDAGYPPATLENPKEKPLLVYLPGFDGTLTAPFLQFPELGTVFDVRGMSVKITDRSTLDDLIERVVAYVDEESLELKVDDERQMIASRSAVLKGRQLATKLDQRGRSSSSSSQISRRGRIQNDGGVLREAVEWASSKKRALAKSRRPIYLIGESFGGILACAVTLELQRRDIFIQGLTLVNPATCYLSSPLSIKGPAVCQLPPWQYPLALLKELVPLFIDQYMWPQLWLIVTSQALPSVIDTPQREAYMGRTAFGLPRTLQFMPQETLKWRLEEWLQVGCKRINAQLSQLDSSIPKLIVVGECDQTLDSIEEARRLQSIWPKAQVHVVPGAGHAATCGSRIDLTAVMRNAFKVLDGRIQMKSEAKNGDGPFYGMTPRYDGKSMGLLPFVYWSDELYQPRKSN